MDLVNFVNAGGGLITSEWTNWKVAQGNFSSLASILPVVSTTQYTGGATITYSQTTIDAELNAGLSATFTFPGDDFSGTESFFAARPGATVYYSSSGGAGGAGLVGWNVGAGRVMQISTVLGPGQLADPNFSRLFQNNVEWAAVPEPATWTLLFCGLGFLIMVRRRRDCRSRP